MNSKAGSLALACLLTFLSLPVPSEAAPPEGKGGGKKKDDGGRGVTVTMEFLDPSESESMKIYGDGEGSYVPSGGNGAVFGEIRNDTGELRFSVSQDRHVHLDFSERVGNGSMEEDGNNVLCVSVSDPAKNFTVPVPAFLMGVGEEAHTTYFFLKTALEFQKIDDATFDVQENYLDLLAMTPGEDKFVQLLMRFEEPQFGEGESFYVRFNEQGQPGSGLIAGIARVRAEGNPANTWYLSPAVVAGFALDQANLHMGTDNGLKGQKGTFGKCDFGDFVLPFELKVSRPDS